MFDKSSCMSLFLSCKCILYWKLLYKLRAQDEYCCLSIVNRWLIVGIFLICPCRKQKSKAYLALQALETDLNSLAQLQRYDVLFTEKKTQVQSNLIILNWMGLVKNFEMFEYARYQGQNT